VSSLVAVLLRVQFSILQLLSLLLTKHCQCRIGTGQKLYFQPSQVFCWQIEPIPHWSERISARWYLEFPAVNCAVTWMKKAMQKPWM